MPQSTNDQTESHDAIIYTGEYHKSTELITNILEGVKLAD